MSNDEQSNKSAVMTVRFSPEEAGLVRDLAQKRNMSASDLIRDAVRVYTQPRFHVQHSPIQATYTPPQPVTVPVDIKFGGNLGAAIAAK